MFNKILEEFENNVPSSTFEKVELDESASDIAKLIIHNINYRLGGSIGLKVAIEKAFEFIAKRHASTTPEKLKELYWEEVTEHLRRTMNKEYNSVASMSPSDKHYTDNEIAMHPNAFYDPIKIVREDEINNMAEPELRQRLARRLSTIAEKLNNGDATSAYEELYGDTGLNWLAPSIKKLADSEGNDS